MKTGWLVGGLAALVLIIGGGWFLMRGPAGSGPVTLFQWQDYMDPPFLADYEKTFTKNPPSPFSPTRTKPSPRCRPASSPM